MTYRKIFIFICAAFCSQISHAQINFEALKRPGPSGFYEGFQQGQIERLQKEQMQLQSETLRLQNEQLRRRIELEKLQASPPVNPTITTDKADSVVMQKWWSAATPRLRLFPDFEKVVLAPDVPLTITMINLMSESEYAADIAYYLASNKAEAYGISQMPLLSAARAISEIEFRVKPK